MGKIIYSFILTILLLGASHYAYATVSVSFYQDPIVMEHNNILIINDTSNPTGPIYADVKQGLESLMNVEFTATSDPSIFTSEFINFTSDPTNAVAKKLHTNVGGYVQVYYPSGSNESPGNALVVASTISLNSAYDETFNPDLLLTRSNRACSSYGGDSDNDYICNNWETSSGLMINYPTLTPPSTYRLPCNPDAVYSNPTGNQVLDELGSTVCPSTTLKDLYVEIDYMQGHKPDLSALKKVVKAFYDAPTRIQLHVIVDEQIEHVQTLQVPGSITTHGFLQIKEKRFGTVQEREESDASQDWSKWQLGNYTSKFQVFQYFIWGHDSSITGSSSFSQESGTADGANDGVVSLGSFPATVASSKKQQAGTFMHELGHNLGLGHGGPKADTNNCKPNLISVMNYAYQFDDLIGTNSFLDYSRKAIGKDSSSPTSLGLESSIAGNSMIVMDSLPSGEYMVYGGVAGETSYKPLPQTGSINWPSPWNNIRYMADANGYVFCPQPTTEIDLKGYEQWSLIAINHRDADWSQGRPADVIIAEGTGALTSVYNVTRYLPSTITVNVNDTVRWENNDTKVHTITSGNPSSGPSGEFDSGLINSGVAFEHTFHTAGTYDYFNMVHPLETGTVIVSTEPVSRSVSDFIVPQDAWCISPEEAQRQSKLYGLNIDDAPICFQEITVDQVNAARSISIDNIIRNINFLDDKHFQNSKSKTNLINAAENTRTLVLNGQIYESLASHDDFLDLIQTNIINPNAQQHLSEVVAHNKNILNPAMDNLTPPDSDGDGVPNLFDECLATPNEQANERGCSASQLHRPDIMLPIQAFLALVFAFTITGIIIAYREHKRA